MKREEIEKSWTTRGFTFGMGSIKAGDGVDEAVHDDMDELVLMEKGTYEFIIGDKSFTQDGEEEVLIPAGVVHSIKNLGTKDSIIYFGYKQKKD